MKALIVSVIALLSSFDSVIAYPQKRAQCSSPKLRKEWSDHTAAEKKSYHTAVNCLSTKPSKIGLNSTRYDDFTYVHMQLDQHIHFVAQFLPWHRYFLDVYEKELNACGYSGGIPYWDWEKASEAGNVTFATIWTEADGFGGDGIRTGGSSSEFFNRCLTSGPYQNLRPAWWVTGYAPHCLTRQFWHPLQGPGIPGPPAQSRSLLAEQYNTLTMDSVRSNSVFSTFAPALERGPHGAVHTGIGGEMRRPAASPNDPVFFLHHAQIDRVWWLWQQKNPSVRNFDFAGLEFGEVPGTLDTTLEMRGLAADRKVRDFMVTNNEYLCYRY